MNAAAILDGNWSVNVEQEWIDVTSSHETPNERWHFTDAEGHEHRYDHGYPTLTYVIDASHWCNGDEGVYSHDPHEAVDEAHYECSTCREVVEPTMDPPFTPKQIPGVRTVTLSGTRHLGRMLADLVFRLTDDQLDSLRTAHPDQEAMSVFIDALPIEDALSVSYRSL